jgi:hypothetical protein
MKLKIIQVNPPNLWLKLKDQNNLIENKLKNNPSQPRLTCQTRDMSHKIRITS